MSIVNVNGQNRGQLSGDTVANVMYLSSRQFTDVDLVCRFEVSSTLVRVSLIGRATAVNTYYRCDFTGTTFEIFLNNAGVGTVLASTAVAPVGGSYYWMHLRMQGFGATGSNPNNLMANFWADGGSEPGGWMLTASDATLTNPGNFGVHYKATTAGQSATFDSFTATDCPVPAVTPAFHTVGNRPYGVTLYVPNNNTPPLPSQTIIDLIGTCSLGTNSASATGWGKGSWLRYQMRWKNVETLQGFYDWAIIDDAIQKANYWGFRLLWPVQAPPDWQKTRDALGNQCTLSAARNSGTGYTTLAVTALPDGAYIPHKSQITVDWGVGGAETVYVWNPAATYVSGATSIGISTSSSSQVAWNPTGNHSIGAVVWEATSGGTGGPQFANASAYSTLCSLIATRYNGSYGKLDMIQIENEDYDSTNRIGAQGSYGAGTSSPASWDKSSTWDNGGAILAPVYVAARNAVKAVTFNLNVLSCSVRKTPNTGRQHVQNWVNGLVTQVLAAGGTLDGLDFHYYRNGTIDWDGTLVTDPTVSTYMDSGHVTVNAPSVAMELADLKSICTTNAINPLIMVGESGWAVYDDGNGPRTTLTAARNSGTGYTTLAVAAGWTNGANIPDATAITVDWDNVANSEIVYAYGIATNNSTTIQITTNPLGSGAAQASWTPAHTHAISAKVYGATTTNVVATSAQSSYLKAVYDAMRTGGGNYAFAYTMEPTSAVVTTTTNPAWSGSPDSITQIIASVYTYEPAYTMTASDSASYPTWRGALLTENSYGISSGLNPGLNYPVTGRLSQQTVDWAVADGHGNFRFQLDIQSMWRTQSDTAGGAGWDFAPLDDAIHKLTVAGFTITFPIRGMPTWSLTNATYKSTDEPWYLPDPAQVLIAANVIASRYNGVFNIPTYGPMLIHKMELGNEEYNVKFTSSTTAVTLNQTVNSGTAYPTVTISASPAAYPSGTHFQFGQSGGTGDYVKLSSALSINDTVMHIVKNDGSAYTAAHNASPASNITVIWYGVRTETPTEYDGHLGVTNKPLPVPQPSRAPWFLQQVLNGVCPTLQVSFPGLRIGAGAIWWMRNTNFQDFIAGLGSALQYVEWINFHYYSNAVDPHVGAGSVPSITTAINNMRAGAVTAGYPNIAIECTEFGWQVPNDVSETLQASNYSNFLYDVKATQKVRRIYVYTYDDKTTGFSQSSLYQWNGTSYHQMAALATLKTFMASYPQLISASSSIRYVTRTMGGTFPYVTPTPIPPPPPPPPPGGSRGTFALGTASKITLAGVDITDRVDEETINIVDALGQGAGTGGGGVGRAKTASFLTDLGPLSTAVGAGTVVTTPTLVRQGEVTITDVNGVGLYGGFAVNYEDVTEKTTILTKINCVDYWQHLDRVVVNEVYDGQTDIFMVKDLLTKYAPWIQQTALSAFASFTFQTKNYRHFTLQAALTDICTVTGFQIWIEYNKVLHYESPTNAMKAPFGISDAPDFAATYPCVVTSNTLDDAATINRVFFYGGKSPSGDVTQDITNQAITGNKIFTLAFNPHPSSDGKVHVKVNAVEQVIGYGFGPQPKNALKSAGGLCDVILDTTAATLTFDVAPNGATVTCIYRYQNPLVVVLTDETSHTKFGQYLDAVITDSSIFDKQQAIARCRTLLLEQHLGLQVINASMWTPGLRAGMIVNLSHSVRQINQPLMIQQVTVVPLGAGAYRYDLQLGAWDFNFIDVLLAATRNATPQDATTNDVTIQLDVKQATFAAVTSLSGATKQGPVNGVFYARSAPVGDGHDAYAGYSSINTL